MDLLKKIDSEEEKELNMLAKILTGSVFLKSNF